MLRAGGLGESEARERIRASTRAEAGCGDRPRDVSLDAGPARTLLEGLGVTLRRPAEALRSAASA